VPKGRRVRLPKVINASAAKTALEGALTALSDGCYLDERHH
jgi:hypothetical protein